MGVSLYTCQRRSTVRRTADTVLYGAHTVTPASFALADTWREHAGTITVHDPRAPHCAFVIAVQGDATLDDAALLAPGP